MNNKITIVAMILLFSLTMVFAEKGDFSEAKRLIDSKTDCASLSDEQLEQMGDYYMEQMHPGEAHELMDKMHGGEGSVQLKQMHIFMAKRLYCGESSGSYGGMMGLSGGNYGGMMSSGMMGGMMNMMSGGMMGFGTNGYGMMGGSGWNYGWSLWSILWTVLMVGLVVLVILLIIKLIKSIGK